jgi:alpha-beta hydrolase superfamily lysophospholipase
MRAIVAWSKLSLESTARRLSTIACILVLAAIACLNARAESSMQSPVPPAPDNQAVTRDAIQSPPPPPVTDTVSGQSAEGQGKNGDNSGKVDLPKSNQAQNSTTEAKGKDKDKDKDKVKRPVRRGNAPCLSWIDDTTKPKAVLLCVHGLGLHNDSYEGFAERLKKHGVAIFSIDVRGFGSFIQAKGRERVDFDGCMDDVEATLKVLHRAYPGLPVFIMGESMGGAIALRATALYPELIQGLISSVPAGDRFKQGETRLKVALHFLDSANKPFNVGSGVLKQATSNAELREQWSKDPLNKLNLSPNELLQFQHFMNQNHEMAKRIVDRPVLFVQGCKDRLVRPEGTVELFNRLPTPDRRLELISNGEHLIFEENQCTDEEIKIVANWIDEHLLSNNSQTAQNQAKQTNESH